MAAELSWATLSSKTTEDTLPQSRQAGPFQRAWPETSWAGLVTPVLHLMHGQPSEHGRNVSSPHVSPRPPASPPKPSWELSQSALLSTHTAQLTLCQGCGCQRSSPTSFSRQGLGHCL